MSDPADGSYCVMCSKPATQRCTQCRSQIYCGKQCQKSDWRVHKQLCSSYQQFQTPPHENARRAIVFEQDKPIVRFKWVTIEIKYEEDEYPCSWESPILEEYFGPGSNGRPGSFNNNVIRGRRLRNTIDLRFRDTFLIDGSPINQAVAAVAPAEGGPVWCGPLIALKHDNSGSAFITDPPYTHMEMGDLREVVDYLVTYGRPYQPFRS